MIALLGDEAVLMAVQRVTREATPGVFGAVFSLPNFDLLQGPTLLSERGMPAERPHLATRVSNDGWEAALAYERTSATGNREVLVQRVRVPGG